MKLSISSNNILLLGTILLCISLTNAVPKRHRHGYGLKQIRDNVKCPNHNTGVYKEVCDKLQKLYYRSPDKALSMYIHGGFQKAANHIIHPNVLTEKVTFKMVKDCMINFQQMINDHNNEAIKTYRECKKTCASAAGEKFESEMEKAGQGIAGCINSSIH